MGRLDKQLAKEYASDLYSSGISAKTYNNHLKALMLIFRILLADSDMIQNPFSKENIFRKIERKQGREKLSRFQIKQALATFDDPDLHLMHKEENEILFYIGAYSGLRLYDAVYLQWNNIDFQENLIRCIPKKTAKIQRPVVIPLFPQLKEKLDLAKEWRVNSYILPKIANRYDYNAHGVKKDNIRVFRFAGCNYIRDQKWCSKTAQGL